MDEKEKINLMNIMAGNLPILWSKLDMSQEDLPCY